MANAQNKPDCLLGNFKTCHIYDHYFIVNCMIKIQKIRFINFYFSKAFYVSRKQKLNCCKDSENKLEQFLDFRIFLNQYRTMNQYLSSTIYQHCAKDFTVCRVEYIQVTYFLQGKKKM